MFLNKPSPPRVLDLRQKRTEKTFFKSKNLILFVSAAVLLIFLVLVVGWLNQSRLPRPNQFFPPDITSKVDFPLYYPSKLPPSLSFEKESTTFNDRVVIYTIRSNDNNNLVVSMQRKPANVDFSEFHKERLFNSEFIDTPSGGAYFGKFNDALVGSQVTDQTWILVRGPIDSRPENIKEVLQSLERG